MATVLDSLVVELGLDPAKFIGGQKAVAESMKKLIEGTDRGGKEIEAHGKRIGEFFSTAKRSLVEVGALLIGGIGLKDFVGNVANADAAVGRLSKNLNMDVRELSAWQGAAKRAGGSAEGITGMIKKFSTEANTFLLTGQSSLLPLMRNLGMGFRDAAGRMMEPGEQILDLVARLEKSRMTVPEKRAFLQMFGADDDTISFLLRGTEAIKGLMQEARAAGVVTKESAAAADAYNKALVNLDESAGNFWRTLIIGLGPALSAVMDIGAKAIGVFGQLADIFMKITGSLPTLARQLVFGATEDEKAEADKVHRRSLGKLYKTFGEPPKGSKAYGDETDAADRKAMIREYEDFLDAKKSAEIAEDAARKKAGTPQPSPIGAPPSPIGGAASIRYNNPGAQYPSRRATAAFGATGVQIIGGGHPIAVFPTPEQGAASNMDLFARGFTGIPLGAAGAKWTGNHGSGIPGHDPNAVITREMMNDPKIAIGIMKSISEREAGRPSPLSDEQWNRAFKMFQDAQSVKTSALHSPLGGKAEMPRFGAPAAATVSGIVNNDNSRRDTSSSNTTTSTTNIQQVSVNLPGVQDGDGFAREIGPALKRMSFAAGVNSGLV